MLEILGGLLGLKINRGLYNKKSLPLFATSYVVVQKLWRNSGSFHSVLPSRPFHVRAVSVVQLAIIATRPVRIFLYESRLVRDSVHSILCRACRSPQIGGRSSSRSSVRLHYLIFVLRLNMTCIS